MFLNSFLRVLTFCKFRYIIILQTSKGVHILNFLKRAYTSVIRKPGKTAILLVLILILSVVIAGAVSVKEALANTKQALLNKMNIKITPQIDYDKMSEDDVWSQPGFKTPELDYESMQKIGASEYLTAFFYSMNAYGQTKDLKYYSTDENGNYVDYGSESASLQLYGNSTANIEQVQDGSITVTEGRLPNAEELSAGANVMLISKEVAQISQKSVGDTVKFYYELYDWNNYNYEDGNEPQPYKTVEREFTIIGIFEAKPQKYTDEKGEVHEQPSQYLNTTFTTTGAVNSYASEINSISQQLSGYDEMYINASCSFLLKDPTTLEIFESENQQNLPKYWKFTDNSSAYDNIQAPMENIGWLADIIMWVAVFATILIISLVVTLFLRDRKHEMGIYLALGEKKLRVAGQILAEVVAIALIAVTLSVPCGNLLAKDLSQNMFENQLTQEQDNSSNSGGIIAYDAAAKLGGYGGGGIWYGEEQNALSNEEILEMYTVKLDAKTILFIYLIGMGSVIVSTIIPLAYTLQLKPRKILL